MSDNNLISSNSSQIDVSRLCDELLANDKDGVITAKELELFIKNLSGEETHGFDTVTISGKMKIALGDKYKEDSNSNNSNQGTSFSIEEYNNLLKTISSLKDGLAENNVKLTQLQAAIISQKEVVDEKKAAFLREEQKLAQENEEYEKIINQINSNTENLEDDIKTQQKALIYKGLSEYDPEKDGDWEKFVTKFVEGHAFDSVYESNLRSLVKNAGEMADSIRSLASKLKGVSEEFIQANDLLKGKTSEYSSLQDVIKTDTAKLNEAQESAKNNILSLVSADEVSLVTKNSLNLQEKLSSGKPRYIFAKGKEDGIFHIYDMSDGSSLVRQYECDGGFDKIASGNGYITGFQEATEGACDAQEYYYYNDCGEIQSSCATYSTCSPLSFDVNGDGVQTSSKVINYDIDGDGIIDKINDSADAVLVFDKDGDGISGADGSETFGNNTDLDGDGVKDGYKNGFEALKALAKKEGMINGIDDNELNENDLKLLEQKYGLKIKTGGYNSEAKSLSEVGITSIKLSPDNSTSLKDNFDGNGNQLMTQQGATFTINGEERAYADIWHKKQGGNTSSGTQSVPDDFDIPSTAISFDMDETINTSSKLLSKGVDAEENAYRVLKGADAVEDNIFLELINHAPEDTAEKQEEEQKAEDEAKAEAEAEEEKRKKEEEQEEK